MPKLIYTIFKFIVAVILIVLARAAMPEPVAQTLDGLILLSLALLIMPNFRKE